MSTTMGIGYPQVRDDGAVALDGEARRRAVVVLALLDGVDLAVLDVVEIHVVATRSLSVLRGPYAQRWGI